MAECTIKFIIKLDEERRKEIMDSLLGLDPAITSVTEVMQVDYEPGHIRCVVKGLAELGAAPLPGIDSPGKELMRKIADHLWKSGQPMVRLVHVSDWLQKEDSLEIKCGTQMAA